MNVVKCALKKKHIVEYAGVVQNPGYGTSEMPETVGMVERLHTALSLRLQSVSAPDHRNHVGRDWTLARGFKTRERR